MSGRLRSAGRALTAGVVLVLLLTGVPLLLSSTIGNPLDGLPALRAGDLSDTVVIDVVAAVAYVAWAQFALAVTAELIARARHLPAPRRIPGVFAGQQHLAHALVSALLVAGPTLAGVTVIPAVPAASPAQVTGDVTRQVAVRGEPTARPAASRPHDVREVTVTTDGPGTYWDLARVHLGSGERWHEIWAINQGRHQADGAVMSSPGLLRPGWTVLLPVDTISPAETGDRSGVRPVIVQRGDTLSGIAEASGDTAGWTHLWKLNHDRREPPHQRFTDPDHIEPGWTIDVPTTGPTTGETAAPPAAPAQPPSTSPPPVLDPSPTPSPPGTPSADLSPTPAQPSEDRLGTVAATTAPTPVVSPASPPAVTPAVIPGQGNTTPPTSPATGDIWTPVSLVGAGFGGGLLTGVTLTALARHRRRQFRYRRPGRAIATTPPDLVPMEKTLLTTGSVGIVDVTWLDHALRTLTQRLADAPDGRLPDVVAVRMDRDVLELVLTDAAPDAPAPWKVDTTGLRWSVRRSDALGYDESRRSFGFAPYPALVSVGYTAAGEQWLVDLERAGGIRLTGDHERCLNLARFVAAELAHNVWSEQVDVELVGFGAEMARLNPERLHYNHDADAAISALRARRATAEQVLDRSGTDVLTGRLRGIDADIWMPLVVLLAEATGAVDTDTAQRLLQDATAGGRRTAVAVLAAVSKPWVDAASQAPGAMVGEMIVDASGNLRIPALGLELIAQQVPMHEAAQLSQLLAAAADTEDRPTPASRGDRPWEAHSDAAGAPTVKVTVRPATSGAASASSVDAAALPHLQPASQPSTAPDAARIVGAASVLSEPATTYVERAATTAEDVATLAPAIPDELRRRIQASDPTLDDDLGAWHDPNCPLPRITLLGPVDVAAHGPLPQSRPRKAWNVEVVAYLACRPRGVSAEQFGTDLWPNDPDIASKTKLRQAIHIARKWLGTNPRTGLDHLPPAVPSPGGPALYRVDDVLVDADLFRRLRQRGVASGPAGIADLQAALKLVTGTPFDQRRPGGYAWLAETPLDHEYLAMIVDVAHLVATHHLAEGQPARARAAAETALTAGSSDDIALLDLVAVCDAEGNRAEAALYVQRIMANHDAEVEEDLPPRTASILHRRWMSQAG